MAEVFLVFFIPVKDGTTNKLNLGREAVTNVEMTIVQITSPF